MLNSPEGYRKENENKSIEELILERTKLFNEMVEYEQKHIINNEPEEVTKPSPKDIYNMHNLYLKEITDLIIENYKKEKDSSEVNFYKKNETDTIWWIEKTDSIGEHLFSFDKKKIYNLFKDYPYELSNEEKEIFDKENPYWADFFKDRQKTENNNPNSIKESNSDKIKNGYTYSFDDYKRLFEKDNDSFIRLIIPSDFLKMILDTNNSEDMNLIGKKNLDFSTNEVIVLKKYAGYVYDHILDPNGQKDIDRTIYVLVDVIEHLPKGTEISISQILGKNFSKYDTNELFEINKKVLGICKEKGVEFNFDKYKDQEVGLPFNIPFIIE